MIFVGFVLAFFADALLFHPLADGTAARAYHKAREKTVELLADKEAMEAFFQLVEDACAARGLVDEGKVKKVIAFADGNLDKAKELIDLFTGADAPAPVEGQA
ncbi:MAG: hypothetical protein GX224_04470 [Thermoplasmatales archaeon]|nr:hypothetical protein [Thermoplasmatales archaeon]